MSLTPFATTTELASFWRPLTPDETSRAETLLTMASNYLRQIAANNSIDLDAKIAEDTTGLLKTNVKTVVLSATKRAMLTPTDAPPADQWSQSANPYSESITFTNPSNDLFFKKNELQLIGVGSIGGQSQFGVLRGARGVCDELV